MTLVATDYEDDKNDPYLKELFRKFLGDMFMRFKVNDLLVKSGHCEKHIKDMDQVEYDEFMRMLDTLTDFTLSFRKQNGH